MDLVHCWQNNDDLHLFEIMQIFLKYENKFWFAFKMRITFYQLESTNFWNYAKLIKVYLQKYDLQILFAFMSFWHVSVRDQIAIFASKPQQQQKKKFGKVSMYNLSWNSIFRYDISFWFAKNLLYISQYWRLYGSSQILMS